MVVRKREVYGTSCFWDTLGHGHKEASKNLGKGGRRVMKGRKSSSVPGHSESNNTVFFQTTVRYEHKQINE